MTEPLTHHENKFSSFARFLKFWRTVVLKKRDSQIAGYQLHNSTTFPRSFRVLLKNKYTMGNLNSLFANTFPQAVQEEKWALQKMEVFFSKSPQFSADLLTLTKEILGRKLYFSCSGDSRVAHTHPYVRP